MQEVLPGILAREGLFSLIYRRQDRSTRDSPADAEYIDYHRRHFFAEGERTMRQPPGPARKRGSNGSRNHAILMLERALLNGERMDDTELAQLSPADLYGSPLLSKARGEALILSGHLRDGLHLLSRAVKGLAAQGLQRDMLDALAGLAMAHIRTGSLSEAATIVQFLKEEFARSSISLPGKVAHALAVGAYLLDESGETEAYLNAAFDAYSAQEPLESGYGTLLLDVWTAMVPRDELPAWGSRWEWARQQSLLGKKLDAHVRCVQGMSRFHANDMQEAVTMLGTPAGLASSLGHDHTLIVRCYRFLAQCRLGTSERMPTEQDYRRLDRELRKDEANLILRFQAEIVTHEWLRLRADSAGALAARRAAAVIQGLSRLPAQARTLVGLDESDARGRGRRANPNSSAESGHAWRFYCFGRLRIVREGMEAEAPAWKRKKTKELLVYLLLQPKYESPKDRVVELLFAGDEPEKAANKLYVAIHELKKTLFLHLGQTDAVALKEGQVRLNERLIDYSDVEQFGNLARVGEQLWREDRELALEMFDRACQLYDDLLPEMPYVDWLEPYRESLAERQSGMLRRLALQTSARGDLERAESYIGEWLRIKPLLEEAHHERISLLMRSGRPSEAREWYRSWERTCRLELGSAPMPETRQLVAEVHP